MPTRRRLLLSSLGLGVTGLGVTALVGACTDPVTANGRILTPRQTEGPFYPVELPLDSDNDLVQVAGRPEPARGVVTHVFGKVTTAQGRPLSGARVEIWQCDADGRYHHPGDRGGQADPNFQGFGAFDTADDAAFRFRTIRPVSYPGRTPHIHVKVKAPGMETLTTQMYVAGEAQNERDGVLRRIRDPRSRANILVALNPAPEVEAEALAGTFNIVIDHPDAS